MTVNVVKAVSHIENVFEAYGPYVSSEEPKELRQCQLRCFQQNSYHKVLISVQTNFSREGKSVPSFFAVNRKKMHSFFCETLARVLQKQNKWRNVFKKVVWQGVQFLSLFFKFSC